MILKIAIVNDYLMQMGGSERVIWILHKVFPEAPIYTIVYDAEALPEVINKILLHQDSWQTNQRPLLEPKALELQLDHSDSQLPY